MRIIIKRCRVGTSLLQSAPRQKQEGQRQRVRKAALLNILLDLISFGHFQHQAKPSRIVSFHRRATLFPHCNVSGLSKSLLDFTVALKTFFSLRTTKSRVSVNSMTRVLPYSNRLISLSEPLNYVPEPFMA